MLIMQFLRNYCKDVMKLGQNARSGPGSEQQYAPVNVDANKKERMN